MKKSEKKKLCAGCDNNFYNKNPDKVIGDKDECWNLESAKPVRKKEIHVSDRPPWDSQPVKKVLDCYRRSKYVYVEPDRKR